MIVIGMQLPPELQQYTIQILTNFQYLGNIQISSKEECMGTETAKPHSAC